MKNDTAVTSNPLVRLAIGVLPDRMKRIMYLASLMAIAKDSNIPEEKLISKLNKVLKLSTTNDAALKLPIFLSQLIWSNETVFKADIETLTNCDSTDALAIESADRITSSIPSWFTYSSHSNMSKDLIALFSKESRLFRPDFGNTQALQV
jgi:hypothetical protein